MHVTQAAEPLPPAVIKQIAKELKDLQEKPEEGIKVGFLMHLRAYRPTLSGDVQINTFGELVVFAAFCQ